ncbi:unnamed protein product [Closterium sp. Naga37s-1]|nr:unnamed protein product [Closterium sp. Naga37s-1]
MKDRSSGQQQQQQAQQQQQQQQQQQIESSVGGLKSLTSACVTTPAGKEYDIVAVSFWLAALQEGCSLVKLSKAGMGRGQPRSFVVVVENGGSLSLKWEKQGLMGKVARSAQLLSTEPTNAASWEFLMETSAGAIVARAPSEEWFQIWTEGMVSVFEYARSMRGYGSSRERK